MSKQQVKEHLKYLRRFNIPEEISPETLSQIRDMHELMKKIPVDRRLDDYAKIMEALEYIIANLKFG